MQRLRRGRAARSCSLTIATGWSVRDGKILDRFRLGTGELLWRRPLPGRFTTARPLVQHGHVLLVTGDGLACRVDLEQGAIDGMHQLRGQRQGWGPYRNAGAGAPTDL
jgi:PQQ-like domain